MKKKLRQRTITHFPWCQKIARRLVCTLFNSITFHQIKVQHTYSFHLSNQYFFANYFHHRSRSRLDLPAFPSVYTRTWYILHWCKLCIKLNKNEVFCSNPLTVEYEKWVTWVTFSASDDFNKLKFWRWECQLRWKICVILNLMKNFISIFTLIQF